MYYKSKSLCLVFLLIMCTILVACSGSGSPASNPNTERLVISSPTESNLAVGESATATVTIENLNSNKSVIVLINNNDSSTISVTPSNCILSLITNSCSVTVTGIAAGTATFSAATIGVASVTSETITVTSIPVTGLLFGTIGGLVFNDNTLLLGNTALSTIDNSQIQGVAIDSNNNIYAGTFGAIFGGFGAGKVFKYNSHDGYWVILPGNVSGGSLDGSCINALAVDSKNNVYAGTNAGNVFKYANGIWTILGVSLNDPIKAMVIDSSNNIYVGTENAGKVFKYVNTNWLSLGAPDGTMIQSIAISSNGSMYAATNGNTNGQVYSYVGSNTWHAISSFADGSVNTVAVDGNIVFAGTAAGNVYSHSGSSWSHLGNSPDTTAVMTLIANSSGIYAGTYGSNYNGQVYSYSGSSWNQLGALNDGHISVVLMNNNNLYTSTSNAGGTTQGMVYIYTANAWNPIGSGALDGTPIYATTVDNSDNFYAASLNNVYKYTASSKVWVLLGNLYALDSSGLTTLITYESAIYAGTSDGKIFRSNTSNANWAQLGSAQPSSSISYLAVDKNGQLYASVNDSTGPNNGTVWKYNSNTGIWILLSGSGAAGSLDDTTIQSITLDSLGNIYAATAGSGAGGFVWEYPVGTNSWVTVGLGTLDGSSILSLTTDSDLNIYAGTTTGNVFEYNGSYWIPLTNTPLDGSGVSNVTFANGGNLYATTYGGMIWEYVKSNNLWINTNYGIGTSINVSGGTGF